MLGVFLFPAFTRLGHECQDLLSPCDGMHVSPDSGMLIFRYFWPNPFSVFSYFIFLFLNVLSLFVFIFCETARTRRFSVIFAKVQWHPCRLDLNLYSHPKEFWENGVRTQDKYKGKIPTAAKILPGGVSSPRRCIELADMGFFCRSADFRRFRGSMGHFWDHFKSVEKIIGYI